MRRLLALTGVLCILITGLCGMAVTSRRGAEVSPPIAGLGWCNGWPCYRGVTAGQTRWLHATNVLSKEADQVSRNMIEIGLDRDVRIIVWRLQQDVNVREVVVELMYTAPLSLAQVVAAYGPPCGVTRYPDFPNTALLTYPHLSAIVRLPGSSASASSPLILDLATSVNRLWFRDNADLCAAQANERKSRDTVDSPWLGFASLNYYESHQH